MKVIYGIGKVKKNYKNPVLSIGIFDGVHLGHRYLIDKALKKTRQLNGTNVVLTFFPHPIHVLKPDIPLSLLVSLCHRLKLIEELGVDICIVVKFTKQFSRLSPQDFVMKYLARAIKPKDIFVGCNFCFGKGRQGDISFLREMGKACGYRINAISSRKYGGSIVSSTRIRNLIQLGNMREAKQLIGRSVSLLGKVVKGEGRGRKLGFPTANIYPSHEVVPPRGVYMVEIIVNKKKFLGMANIGWNPSFRKVKGRPIVEAHIFHFNKNLYKKEIEIKFLKKIRDEKKFSTAKDLKTQLKKDKRKIQGLFRIR